jgi:hypothetical protein
MANELQFRYGVSARTVKFLLWNSVGQVWNGSSFVAYATANLNTYAITTTEQGTASGRYTATMPTSTTGIYSVEAYDQAGGSLAETDTLIGVLDEFLWTGTAVPSTVNDQQGTTQPVNFTGTGASALVKVDAIDWASGAIPAPNVTGVPIVDVKYWLGTVVTAVTAGIPDVNVKNINNVVAATPGAAGGILIAGSNAATTISSLTLTGANASGATPATSGLTVTGGAASTSVGGTSAAGISVTGGSGAASTNGASDGINSTGGGTTTVSGANGVTFVGTGNKNGIVAQGAGSGDGLEALGGATGRGAYLHGGASSGDGCHMTAGGSGQGLLVLGTGAHHGATFTSGSGATGDGAQFVAASAAGSGITGIHTSTGFDLNCTTSPPLQVNVTQVNAVSTSSVTTVNANQGTTQPVNFDGTGATAFVKCDVEHWETAAPAALSASGYVQVMLQRWLTDNAAGTPNALISGDVEAAPDWAHIQNPTTVVNLSGTTIATITGQLTAAQIATGVWQDIVAGDFTVSGSIGKSLFTSGNAPGAASGLALVGSNMGTVSSVTGNVAGSVGSISGVTFPTNFGSLVISVGGLVQVDLTEAVPTSNASNTLGDCLNAARAQGFGKWVIAGTTLTLYAPDGTTAVRTFTLDSASAPTQRV